MKITVFSAKGGVGKTPISTNIAFDLGYMIATNDEYHGFDVVERIKGEDRLLVVPPTQEFPEIPADMDVVFDLGGTLSGGSAPSIRSAILQSNVVLIPVSNETKAIISAVHTVTEVSELNKNMVLVATKLKRHRKENSLHPWSESLEFQNIKKQISALGGRNLPIFPLKLSTAFDALYERELSIREMVAKGGIDAHSYQMPAQQFEDIYEHLKRYQ